MHSDARFRKLIENNYSGITLLDKNFEIIYRSPSAERITGWSTEKRKLMATLMIVHPDDQAAVIVVMEKVLSVPGLSLTCTFRSMHYSGSYIWLENTYSNLLEEPDIQAIVCNFRDVTAQRVTEDELKKQATQISELLETMTDSFIALDEKLCYTYANTQVGKLLGRSAASLIGQHIWTLFPEAVGSATYQAIQTAFTEKKYVCNEDFYAPLRLWQENRIYPSAGGVSVFIRDITRQKKEQHHLKLLESVITNTMDAVMITEAEPFDEPGPQILYVNEAFTKMTGYSAAEVIGKTPRILQGPKTDREELERLSEHIRRWEPCEVTLINYKKSGEEFWINFTLNPVADEKGWYTHWISIDRDVTVRKNEELEKLLLSGINSIFNEPLPLNLLLEKMLNSLVAHGDFKSAEVWLIGADKNRVSLAAQLPGGTDGKQNFAKGEGLPGAAWASGTIAAGEKSWGIPLISENIVIGVLVLGRNIDEQAIDSLSALFESFSTHFGAAIKRKQLEQDLDQVFNFAPDIIAIVGTDRYFKKVNQAMCVLLEYTRDELLSMPMNALVHPDELAESKVRTQSFINSPRTVYFENRFVTKSGKNKWISWTATSGTEEGLIFCVGKDISDKKSLETLLNKVTDLAKIGGWEIDLIKNTLYWSKVTREIHEVNANFEPDLQSGIAFYDRDDDRDYVTAQITSAMENGTSFDFELLILSAKHNKKWVRVVGEPEFVGNNCTRIYGSFQDVDVRVKAQIKAREVLLEKNTILESIGDAFFAVDKHWTVNYWNKMAEQVLGKSREEMIDRNLWSVFSDSTSSESFKQYHHVLESNLPAHFEDYYSPLDKWYEISAYPSGNGLSVYFKDITERKCTQQLLEASEKKYSELFQLSPLPKWVFDVETLRFLDINKAAIDHYGYSREEFMNMTIKDIRPAEDMPLLISILERHRLQHQFTMQGTVTHHKKNGEKILVEIQSNDIEFKGKKARVIIASDITDRVNYIKAIELQNEKLKEISWMQSHVIRAPLARLMGLMPFLDEIDPNPLELEQIKEYIKLSIIELDEVIRNITNKTSAVDYKPPN